jgi:hypothetical protein
MTCIEDDIIILYDIMIIYFTLSVLIYIKIKDLINVNITKFLRGITFMCWILLKPGK